jgi:hypothetical protein
MLGVGDRFEDPRTVFSIGAALGRLGGYDLRFAEGQTPGASLPHA